MTETSHVMNIGADWEIALEWELVK